MALMGLDNIEWTAAILDEANKENKIKTKKQLEDELDVLIRKYKKRK